MSSLCAWTLEHYVSHLSRGHAATKTRAIYRLPATTAIFPAPEKKYLVDFLLFRKVPATDIFVRRVVVHTCCAYLGVFSNAETVIAWRQRGKDKKDAAKFAYKTLLKDDIPEVINT